MNSEQPPRKNKLWIVIGVVALVVVLSVVGVILSSKGKQDKQQQPQGSPQESHTYATSTQTTHVDRANSTDPVERGKELSGDNCTGTGSKLLNSPPMRPEDTSYIIPLGLLAGGHVTPIDHQYYWGKVPMSAPDTYDVLALGDGKIVNISYRSHNSPDYAQSKVKGDYRVVIMYSCTFFSYFDLATSMAPDIAAQLPSGWEQGQNPNINTNISIKEGQVIAKMGGQSLDFAIWDTTKTLKNLLVPIAYNNAEPWKINTVPSLDYFTDKVKQEILPLYLRKVEPLDGVIDQDVDGTASGNWFLQGTNGYAGSLTNEERAAGKSYSIGHLAMVHDLYDPSGWVFSSGDVNGQPKQFGIISPTVAPDKLTTASGAVKYQLGQWEDIDDTGSMWTGQTTPKGNLKFHVNGTSGTVLVQLLDTRKLQVELFLGKTPAQVTGFTSAAKTYDRGDSATLVESNTAH